MSRLASKILTNLERFGGLWRAGEMILDKIGPDVEIRYSYDYPGNDIATKSIRQNSINHGDVDLTQFE